MHSALSLLLLLQAIVSSYPVATAPIQIPLGSPPINHTTSTNNIAANAPNNNVTSFSNSTIPHVPAIPNKHARLRFKAIYDICLSWKTISQQQDYFCRRVKLDRAAASRITRQQVASALMSSSGPLPTTVLLALSADQQGEALRPFPKGDSSLDWRDRLSIQHTEMLKSAPATLREQHGFDVESLREERLSDWVDDILVLGLGLSVLVELVVLWLMVSNVALVSTSSLDLLSGAKLRALIHVEEQEASQMDDIG